MCPRLLTYLVPCNVRKLLVSVLTTVIAVLVYSCWQTLWLLFQTLPRDLKGAYRSIKARIHLQILKQTGASVGDLLNKTVAIGPERICFYFKNEKWTFREVQEFANKVGNYFSSLGYRNGDTVGLFMENCPEYVAIWLGLSKIGVVSALINTSLRMQSLKHCFDTVHCKAVIYGEELTAAFQEVISTGRVQKIPIFSYSRDDDVIAIKSATNLMRTLMNCSSAEPRPLRRIDCSDGLFYVYTAGTTGLPKVTMIQHWRFVQSSLYCHYMNDLKPDDIIYTPLPLHHVTGGVLGVGQALLFRNGLVLRKKFSPVQFWSDCIRYRATVVQYIGDMPRYLLAQPEGPEEWLHQVRLALGSGLTEELWDEFKTRFRIETVAEFYTSTEAPSFCLSNIDGMKGAMGFVPRMKTMLMIGSQQTGIVRVDIKSGEILRNPVTDLGIQCAPNEPGELVGKIAGKHLMESGTRFSNRQCLGKRVARNVLAHGDWVFRTGDIVTMDTLGYIYFKDRLVDVFLWRGSPVFPSEWESMISRVCDFRDCAVYGVRLPQTKEMGLMVTVADPDCDFQFENFVERMQKLPFKRLPAFIRVTSFIEQTGTYKYKKTDLAEDGFNPQKLQDDLYVLVDNGYETLNEATYSKIMSGEIYM